MRKHYLIWSIGIYGIIGTIYGAYAVIYNYNHSNKLSVLGLVLLISGLIALGFYISLWIADYFIKKKKKNAPVPPIEEKKAEEEVKPTTEEVKSTSPQNTNPKPKQEFIPKSERPRESVSYYASSTIYVKQVGYGPLLRLDGNRILDMRNNVYYRIENNMVMQEGYGPVYEIRGNQIRDAFGGYLYELSGNNINKVFGGFYASISGNYITLYDLSIKYETTDTLSKKQTLVVAALLFGKY